MALRYEWQANDSMANEMSEDLKLLVLSFPHFRFGMLRKQKCFLLD
jgi:hypothetical protein